MEDDEWGSALIDGVWRACLVGGLQWQMAAWRVKTGFGASGAAAAAKKAAISNQFRRDHPTKEERRYDRGKSPPVRGKLVLRNTQQLPPEAPITQGRVPPVLLITPKPRKTAAKTTRTHPNWEDLGGRISMKIPANHHAVAVRLAQMDDRPTVELAIARLIAAGIESLPPAVQDALRQGVDLD
jgi:hypothetical protein